MLLINKRELFGAEFDKAMIKQSCGVDCGRLDAQILSSSACGSTTWRLRQQLQSLNGHRADNSMVPVVWLCLHHCYCLPEPTGTAHIAILAYIYNDNEAFLTLSLLLFTDIT